jgi:DNA-binding MarR family transcriptional regulator
LPPRGLITRLQSSADGRRNTLQLTAAGRTTLARAKSLAAQHESRLAENLGRERHEMLIRALRDV